MHPFTQQKCEGYHRTGTILGSPVKLIRGGWGIEDQPCIQGVGLWIPDYGRN